MPGRTTNDAPLLATPPTVTTMFPELAACGTVTVMLVELQFVAVPAARPLNVTVLVPWLAPKLAPVMVIAMPALPAAGDRVEIVGVAAPASKVIAAPADLVGSAALVAVAVTDCWTVICAGAV